MWHTLTPAKALALLKAEISGLSLEEADKRLKKYGPNQLPEEKKISGALILLNQFKSPLVFVLLAAAFISLLLNDLVDTVVILIGVFFNTVLGFYQEYKANRAVSYLKKLINFKVRVLRAGAEQEIDAKKIVPGDIVYLYAGDRISFDGRILEIDNFLVTEATLTGESMPIEKKLAVLSKGAILADRTNMVFSGTTVARGKAKILVCETGIGTELGQITKLVQAVKEEKTPLQLQLSAFSGNLTLIVLGICAGIFVLGALEGRPLFGFGSAAREGMLNTAVAVAVAAIPEGLLISFTAILAIAMQAILRQKALVRRLIAAETLGSVSVICTDKTGTLTEGRMRLAKIVTYGEEINLPHPIKYAEAEKLIDHDLILKVAMLCNDAAIENPKDSLSAWRLIGDPTETALLLGSLEASIPLAEIKKQQPRLAEIPFDSEFKFMATLNRLHKATDVIYVKGAPEKIIAMCSQVRINGAKVKISAEHEKQLRHQYEKLSGQGLRLLAFAYKQQPLAKNPTLVREDLTDMTFVGLVALKDPLRPEAKETILLARQAGIRPIIVTGDHKLTAKAIVLELGIKIKDSAIIEGGELDQISDDELLKKVKQIDIYARVEPRHKLRIVEAWRKNGEVVAMTGDGVNDSPALKAADIGIALGSGTDVAKETSDVILLDNNFKTIIAAVERGRIAYENIKKIILYLMADNFSEVILIAGALLLRLPLPVLPAQIIWVNLIDDGFPSMALTFEPGEAGVMEKKPRKKTENIMDREMKVLIFIIAIITDLVLLSLFYFLFKIQGLDLSYVRTLIFTALGLDSLFYVFSCRSLRHSILASNPFKNRYIFVSVFLGLILQLLAIYEPHLQRIFETVPLNAISWVVLLSFSLFKIFLIELTKYFFIIKQRTVHV